MERHLVEMGALRRRLGAANGGTDGSMFILGYLFITPERLAQCPQFYIVITDEDEIARVKAGWKPRHPDMNADPAPGRICVIGSYN